MAIDMKQLMVRTCSGLVYVALIVLACWIGKTGVAILGVLFATLGLIELEKMIYGEESVPKTLLVLDVICCICLPLAIYGWPLMIFFIAIIIRALAQLYVNDRNPVKNLTTSAFSICYLGVPLLAMVLLSSDVYDQYRPTHFEEYYTGRSFLILAVFCMIWINDTGAFIVGSLIGRHKLFERISPKKTWEGFFGGLIFNIGAGIAAFYIFKNSDIGLFLINEPTIYFWVFLGVIVTIFGTFGDLLESLIKRSLRLKDSGHLIPGHGGILDRIDSLLLVMPAVCLYFLFYDLISF